MNERTAKGIPWLVLAVWVVALVVAAPFAGRLFGAEHNGETGFLPSRADSTRVAELAATMPGGGTTDLQVVYHRAAGLTDSERAVAGRQAGRVAARYGLPAPSLVASKDGTTVMFMLAVPESKGSAGAVTEAVRAQASHPPDGVSVQVTGAGAVAADMDAAFGGIDGMLMLVTVLVVAVLLVMTYRSPVLWIVPLAAVGAAAATAMALVYGLVQWFGLTLTAQSSGIMTVLVFGAGTDYALLLIARYRDELRRHERPGTAMGAALRRCGPAVLASAGTVAAGLLCLMVADMNSSRGMGPVGAVGVVCALVAMTTLLPALLVLLGRRVFWPLIPSYGSRPARRGGLFAWIGGTLARRPVAVLTSGVLLLGALALGIGALPGDLGRTNGFTATPESVSGLATVARSFPGHAGQPITVMARSGQAVQVLSVTRSSPGIATAGTGRSAGGWTEISARPAAAPGSAAEHSAIAGLRQRLHQVSGARALVGGPSAQQYDKDTASARDLAAVVPLVLAVVLGVLMLLLRSLVAPVLLVAAVVAVWAAALGIGGLVFGPLFGFTGSDPSLPLLSFVFLVALGVDYGIFLMHRMREAAQTGAAPKASVLDSLTATGAVIASAGLVLAATFSVLTVLPLVMMVELGFTVAVGVLLDAFLVRSFLLPAASLLLGRRIWWPGRLARTHVADQAQELAPARP
jgi:RND superfamily putative drug exporter